MRQAATRRENAGYPNVGWTPHSGARLRIKNTRESQ